MSASDTTITTLLRAHAPKAPETLRARVLELEPRPRSASRRLVLVAVPAAAAIAVAAALVHGFVGSSPTADTSTVAEQQKTLSATAQPSTGNGAFARVAPHSAPKLPSVGGAATRLQHTEATLEIRVKDASTAATKATRVATGLGGYAQSVTYSSSTKSASVVLHVPAQNVKTALARLAGLGTIVSQNLSVTDLQHDFQLESERIAQLRRTIAALEKALRSPSLPEAQRVLLRIRLANAKRALAQRIDARTGTVTAGTTATIALTLSTKHAVVAPPPARSRLDRMLRSAVGFLGLEATVALYVLIVASPLAFVAALTWSLREARRRRLERLVME
jgi:Domain of unknown function (DUF4349)